MTQNGVPQALLEHARRFVNATLPYQWSELERQALEPFFSNLERRVFFMHNLPAHVGATIFSMFSRLRNPRGIRGIFVDQFLPQVLATTLDETHDEFGGDELKFLKHRNIKSLDDFNRHSDEANTALHQFINGMRHDPKQLALLAESAKVRKFLTTWLDKYGHNSIARMGTIWLGFEQISVLAVKSIAWARPGAAQIGLSFRYTDASMKECYPIAEELAILGADPTKIREVLELSFRRYRELSESFPAFLREYWGQHSYFSEHQKELETGVIGETYDVLGNLLPAATLQSVGFSVSGEALPSVLKHLLLDDTPENRAIVEAIVEEARKTGAIQFCRHYEPTEWERAMWNYLDFTIFYDLAASYEIPCVVPLAEPKPEDVERTLRWAWRLRREFSLLNHFDEALAYLVELKRGEYDKLPRSFELVTVPFIGVMSFRGWRDLQRQSLSTHQRTYLTARLGFYNYDKRAPMELHRAFAEISVRDRELENELEQLCVPPVLRQYVLALGNNIGFLMSSNLRQWEFCNWQRTKWSVNHEVRQTFLAIEKTLRRLYPWWGTVSRADLTPTYVFARGKKGVPLTDN